MGSVKRLYVLLHLVVSRRIAPLGGLALRVVAIGHPENRHNLQPNLKLRVIAPQWFSSILNKGWCQLRNWSSASPCASLRPEWIPA